MSKILGPEGDLTFVFFLISLQVTMAIMKFQNFFSTIIAASAFFQGAAAWGAMGHETVAFIAQNYLSAATKSWAQGILGDTSTSYLASVATWADTYRYTSAGAHTRPYHFIDAQDDPLGGSCGVDYTRDCGTGGCVVSAVNQYVS